MGSSTSRRGFLKRLGAAGFCGTVAGAAAQDAAASAPQVSDENWMGVLVDLPQCIGCRKCEYACKEAAGFSPPPMPTFDDKSVFAEYRRPQPDGHTVVNRFTNDTAPPQPVYVKTNCLHCKDPACVSACLVGAFQREANGAVVYDPWKCMGCRYCMVACPFQIPTYEYDNALTPQVRNCTLCFGKTSDYGGVPACVSICPNDCLTYGKRSELIERAHERIRRNPDIYVDHVYGEHEAGGTSWLYLSSVPFERLEFVSLGSAAPPRLTEAIQHGVFKRFMPPLALYGILGLTMWLARPREQGVPVPVHGHEPTAPDDTSDEVFDDERVAEPEGVAS